MDKMLIDFEIIEVKYEDSVDDLDKEDGNGLIPDGNKTSQLKTLGEKNS
jgi:hypothetical protein